MLDVTQRKAAMLLRISLGFALALLAAGAASAESPEACGKFKWSVQRELARIAEGPAAVANGAAIAPDKSYHVTLTKDGQSAFAVAPERAPKAGASAASLTINLAAAGTYQVSLSDEGWIDVAQGGRTVKSSGFSGQKGCPGLRKSVRFALVAGATILEISNVEGDSVDLEVEPAN